MNNNAIILDTETHDLKGLVIQLAYVNVKFEELAGSKVLVLQEHSLFNQMYSIGENKINYAAMAVHNILDSDLVGNPDTSTITLPFDEGFIIGHNIDYDIEAIATSTGVKTNLKPICTLALARMIWPELPTHKLTSLMYYLFGPTELARSLVSNSHDAASDIRNTGHLLSAISKKLNIFSMEELYLASCQARIPTKMPFGKHKGTPIEEVPRAYMTWFINQDNPDIHICEAFKKVLNSPKKKGKTKEKQPDPQEIN